MIVVMPTMSLAECARREMEMEIVQGSGVVQSWESESDDDVEKRVWDDWRDENPRGSGNKMVNRG